MGSRQSSLLPETEIEEYCALTYFDRREIIAIFEMFMKVAPDQVRQDRLIRLPAKLIIESIPELKFNPFKERLVHVFSTSKDNCFSFDDLVDLASAFCEKAPPQVRAAFAFRIYDLNNDGCLTAGDLARLVDYLTVDNPSDRNAGELDDDDVQTIIDNILSEAAIEGSSTINEMEFQLLIKKIPDFATSFKFHIL